MPKVLVFFFLLLFTFPVAAQTYIPFQSNNLKYGYQDENEKVSIEARFEEALPFVGDYAFVRENNAWGLINTRGKYLIPPIYEDLGWSNSKAVSPDSTGQVIGYKKEGKWGLVNLKNKHLTQPKYSSLHYLPSGYIKASRAQKEETQDHLYGVIDLRGKEIIPLQYHSLTNIEGTTLFRIGKIAIPVAKNLCESSSCHVQSFGLIDISGKELLPSVHKKIAPKENGIVEAVPFPTWRTIGKEGKERTFALDSLYPVLPYTYAFSINDWKDYVSFDDPSISINKEIQVIKPQQHGFSVFKNANRYGVVTLNTKGELQPFLPARYDSLVIDNESWVRAGIQGKNFWQWDIFTKDEQGRTQKINGQSYSFIGDLQLDSLVKVKKDKLSGFIDLQGNEVIPLQYDSIRHFSDSLTVAVYKGKYGILKKDNTWLFEPKADFYDLNSLGYFIRRVAGVTDVLDTLGKKKYTAKVPLKFLPDGSIEMKVQGKVGRLSPTGVPSVPTQFDSIAPMTADQTFWAFKGKDILLYNAKGESLIKNGNLIQEIKYSKNEFSPVKMGGKYGFVDGLGRLRIANRYEGAQRFSEGLAAIKFLGKWGFMDNTEKIIVQPYYDEVSSFSNGFSMARKGKKWGLLNTQGKELTGFIYDKIERHPTGTFVTTTNGKKGMLSTEGYETIYVKYNELQPLQDGNVVIKLNGKYGLLTQKGVTILPLEYDGIFLNPYSGEYILLNKPKPFEFQANHIEAIK